MNNNNKNIWSWLLEDLALTEDQDQKLKLYTIYNDDNCDEWCEYGQFNVVNID